MFDQRRFSIILQYMRQCEFKKRYDADSDMYVTKHIHGEGITDVFKAVGKKYLEKQLKALQKQQLKVQLQRRLQKLVNMLVRRLVIR